MELAAGVELAHIPYDGMTPVLNDLSTTSERPARRPGGGCFCRCARCAGPCSGWPLEGAGHRGCETPSGASRGQDFPGAGICECGYEQRTGWYAMFVSAKTPADRRLISCSNWARLC